MKQSSNGSTDHSPQKSAAHLPSMKLNAAAETIFSSVKDLPIISPHGHCEPAWFSENEAFSDPTELLIIPDHYVFRMLFSQGVALEDLGINTPAQDRDSKAIFRLFASHWHKFRGTPSHLWLSNTLEQIFGVTERVTSENANEIYDQIDTQLRSPQLRPHALLDSFNIEVLATTDSALDDLEHHRKTHAHGMKAKIIPTFRPDSVLDPLHPDFARDIDTLAEMTGEDAHNYHGYLEALRSRRAYFAQHGATATDHAVTNLATCHLESGHAEQLYRKALSGNIETDEADRLYGHMLTEMAQMSVEDGLVMQIHAGSQRSTNHQVLAKFGPNMGADIPRRTNWVDGMDALLNRVGNSRDLHVLLFTLDETGYSRELAPMAGHWPALRLGPPWWFHDSINGIARYLDQVVETAGYWNLAGFNDDTRAFMSIPARHDLWRRGVSLHLAQQMERGLLNASDAEEIAGLLTRDLAVDAYKLKV